MKRALFAAALVLVAAGCSEGPPTIAYGADECAHCRMNVVDARFGAALRTLKGRTYVFDGPECMVPHVAKGAVAEGQVAAWYVADMAHPGTLIDATTALYLHAPSLNSPMRGNVAAFANEADRKTAMEHFPGEALDWAAVKQMFSGE
ncbi:MAG: nitrous oxide reductase accessory protein NosL [Flavobacteriales bacterium]|nr:hypothetical protein [Flavobacteriales bacterium]MCC6578321.1 nitrous oxide reductase accessory protein NosL [Flavobacteriales bacterium]NUQ15773.1 nitrous oxide reductase accessory protein NosL [Flavobacteriales bacterium]